MQTAGSKNGWPIFSRKRVLMFPILPSEWSKSASNTSIIGPIVKDLKRQFKGLDVIKDY